MIKCACENATSSQFGDHAIRADARCRRIEEDQVGFRLIDRHTGNLREAPRKGSGIGVVVGKPLDMMIEGI